MGNLHAARRKLVEAAALYEECIALAGEAPDQGLWDQVLRSQAGLAWVTFLSGDSSAARALLEEGLPGAVALSEQAGGPGADASAALLRIRSLSWFVLDELEAYGIAHDAAQALVDLARARAEARPDDFKARYDLALAYSSLGAASERIGDLDAAEAHYRQALSEHHALSLRDPSNVAWLRSVGVVAESIGALMRERGDYEEALSWYRESDDVSNRVSALAPDFEGYRFELAISAMQLTSMLKDMERFEEAREELERALDILDRSESVAAEAGRGKHQLAIALHWKAELDVREHQTAPALDALRRASELLASALDTDDQPRLRIDRVEILADLAELEPPPQATRLLDEAQALLEPLLRADPDDPELRERATQLDEIRRKRLDTAAPGPT